MLRLGAGVFGTGFVTYYGEPPKAWGFRCWDLRLFGLGVRDRSGYV